MDAEAFGHLLTAGVNASRRSTEAIGRPRSKLIQESLKRKKTIKPAHQKQIVQNQRLSHIL